MRPFETLERLRGRMAEAMIAQSGIRHPGLAAHLRECLTRDDPIAYPGTLLRKPVIEGAYPFVAYEATLASLEDDLLHPRVVAALDGAVGDPHFPLTRHPYAHQVAAWRHLSGLRDPASAVVSSGTGSGKTECFLVPMLDDMVRRREAGGTTGGVEAIMLYPLNALIESQQERLDAWTAPFDGAVRYALYNGNLDDTLQGAVRRDRLSSKPQEVPDRTELRENPPQILVTNVTMLEYMLVRPQDAPILEASQGRLRWIVLDEAHTLVGSAAAEIALLLRRVMLAFGTDPQHVRFVATSATIGRGEETRERLRRFLADVGGIKEAAVEVIEGHRALPTRPEGSFASPTREDIAALDPAALYERLGSRDDIWGLVEAMKTGTVAPEAIEHVATRYGCDLESFTMALSRARSEAGEMLAPMRVHAMQRAPGGLWSCLNPDCAGAPEGWPWGQVLHERVEACRCGSAVAEIRSCKDCGTVTLHAREAGGHLSPPSIERITDEFALDALREASNDEDDVHTDETEAATFALDRCFAVEARGDEPKLFLERGGTRLLDLADDKAVLLPEIRRTDGACPSCKATRRDNGDKLFGFRFGAPFTVINAVPQLLDGMPVAEAGILDDASRTRPEMTPPKPGWGRQLISFTDSRQGTARMAATLQLDAERNFTRSVLYRLVRSTLEDAEADPGTLATIAKLEAAQTASGIDLSDQIEAERRKVAPSGSVAWNDARDALARRTEVSDWMQAVWGERASVFSDGDDPATQIAQMQMLRELARRPKTANSLETMGLLRFEAPKLRGKAVPDRLREQGYGEEDWYTFLMFLVTFQLRANAVLLVSNEMRNWTLQRLYIQRLQPSGMDKLPGGYFWPFANPTAPRKARAVEMLEMALRLDAGDAGDAALLNEVLEQGRDALGSVLSGDGDGTVQLDFAKLHLAPLTEGHICPLTHRFLDIAPFGLTPYARRSEDKAKPVTMPWPPLEGDTQERRDWLATDEGVATLRAQGLWSDLQDRIALFSPYARAAEHSAQLPRQRLRAYTESFKEQEINVLNCSTTMEMGVDIGSVNGVMMTNVPPSIANYRQRIGRAGRRGQALSMGWTVAKDKPLDREAFADLPGYLMREVAAPRVALDSGPLVQRHVNAHLLGAFLRERSAASLSVTVGDFFGLPPEPGTARPLKAERVHEQFAEWLRLRENDGSAREALAQIVRGSVLQNRPGIFAACRKAIKNIGDSLAFEYEGIKEQAKGAEEMARKALAAQAKRLSGEYLLKTLCNRAFLPGHNFPTAVVSLVGTEPDGRGDKGDWKTRERDDDRRRTREAPSRSLDVALREYAPGAEVVIDGQVYRCGGVTLNWKRPASEDEVSETQDLGWSARCSSCGEVWTGRGRFPEDCPACGQDEISAREMLRPAGFRRDMTVRTHAEIETMQFIPLDDPHVSARESEWRRLPGITGLRYRVSGEGSVLYCNRGPQGHGYGLCLHCGRMEQMEPGREVCDALLDGHARLTAWSIKSLCEGPERPFRIRHGIDLAHETQTDVFELQFEARPEPSAAMAIAIALREVLAARLGVEAEDIGFALRPSRNALGGATVTLALFDRPDGGLGYATQAGDALRHLLRAARGRLDCLNPRCVHACSACVIASDTPGTAEEIDRVAAASFMDAHLVIPEDLSAADRFAPGAELSDAPIAQINRALRSAPNGTVRLYVSDVDTGRLDDWQMARAIRRWCDDKHEVRVVIAAREAAAWNGAERLAVRDFANRQGCVIAIGEAPRFENGSVTLARLDKMIWATHDAGALSPGTWGEGGASVAVATLPDAPEANDKLVKTGSLQPDQGAQVIEISDTDTSMNAAVGDFGARLGKRLRGKLSAAGHLENAGWYKAIYSDRYLRSPLVLRLLLDTLSEMMPEGGIVRIETSVAPTSYPTPALPFHDIASVDEMRGLTVAYGAQRGLQVTLEDRHPHDLGHARRLELSDRDGSKALLMFDQGFGWLEYDRERQARRRLEWKGDDITRATSLANLDGRLKARATHIVVMPPR